MKPNPQETADLVTFFDVIAMKSCTKLHVVKHEIVRRINDIVKVLGL